MISPNDTIASTVANRIQSVLSLCDILSFRLQLADNLLEDLAAVFVTLELIEAGACRRQQNGIARVPVLISVSHSRVERPRVYQRHGAFQLTRDFPCGSADQHGGVCLLRERLAQRSIIE